MYIYIYIYTYIYIYVYIYICIYIYIYIYILYPHIAAECTFELVVLLLRGHVWGSMRVHLL